MDQKDGLCCTLCFVNVPSAAANFTSYSPKSLTCKKVVRVKLDVRSGPDKSMAFPISYFSICITTKRILVWKQCSISLYTTKYCSKMKRLVTG
jgi:hypothetical protein